MYVWVVPHLLDKVWVDAMVDQVGKAGALESWAQLLRHLSAVVWKHTVEKNHTEPRRFDFHVKSSSYNNSLATSAKSLASGWSPLAKEILPASTTAIWTLPPLPITWLDLNREAWSTTVSVLLRFYSFCKMYFSLGTLSNRKMAGTVIHTSDRPRNGKLVFDASMQGRSQNQTKNFAYLQMCTLRPCHVTRLTRPLWLVLWSKSKILSQQPLWNFQPKRAPENIAKAKKEPSQDMFLHKSPKVQNLIKQIWYFHISGMIRVKFMYFQANVQIVFSFMKSVYLQ